jgi:hypothetical protein
LFAVGSPELLAASFTQTAFLELDATEISVGEEGLEG